WLRLPLGAAVQAPRLKQKGRPSKRPPSLIGGERSHCTVRGAMSCPGGKGLRAGARNGAADVTELLVQGGAQGRGAGDDDHPDQGGDQAVFHGGGARLVVNEARAELGHADLL